MTDADADAALVDLLAAIPDEGWQDLATVVEHLGADREPYTWRGGDRQDDGTIQMPWVQYGDAVRAASAWLHAHRLVTVLADWTNWSRRDRYPDAASVGDAPVADAVRLATSIVRGDRFHEGALASAVDDGVLLAILRRFQAWHDDPDDPSAPRGTTRASPPVEPGALVAAVLAAVLGTASAAVSAAWALGSTVLLDTVGGEIERWGRERSAGVVLALVVVVVVKLVLAAAPLVAVVGSTRLPAWTTGRWARRLSWLAAAGLTLYGTVLTVVGLLVQAGVIDASDDADERALAWHAYVWDPWFALWGAASVVALWRSRPRRPGGASPRAGRRAPRRDGGPTGRRTGRRLRTGTVHNAP